MRFSKLIQRRIRKHGSGVDVVGDVNAAIAANVGETRRAHQHVSSTQRIVQRSSTEGAQGAK